MTYAPLIWMLTTAASAPRTTLALKNGAFVVAHGHTVVCRVAVQDDRPLPNAAIAFRYDSTFVAWDRRGLTVRVGSHATSTRLRQIPTSPRLRTRDAIVGTLAAVRTSDRKLSATALSGARRIGKVVYLLVRWQDRREGAWLEALVSVGLAEPSPTPKAVAVLPGVTFSSGAIADNLIAGPAGLAALIHSGPKWGLWTYRPDTEQSAFHELGDGIKFATAVSSRTAAFVEKTDHGSYAVGTVDLTTGVRTDAAEATTLWKVLATASPPVAQATDDAGRPILVELLSGAVFELPDGASARSADKDVVVWQGGRVPTKAWLYDPTTWRPLAWWRSPSQP